MICKQCGKSFPTRKGSYCGGCLPDRCPDAMTRAACRQAVAEGLIPEWEDFAKAHANFAKVRRVVVAALDNSPFPQPRPLRLSDINATTEPNARAADLCIRAQKLGLDAPTEGMIGEAINTAISEVLMWVGGPWHERYYDCRLDGTADRGPEGD